MKALQRWMGALAIAMLLLSLTPTGGGAVRAEVSSFDISPGESAGLALAPRSPGAQENPEPLPRDCDDVTPPGEDPPACCIYGYVYYEGAPLDGASVRLESSQGAMDLTTLSGGASSQPYYSADLIAAPLQVSSGDVIMITASYSDVVSIRTWTVQSDGQHVDLGLVPNYQATGPLAAPSTNLFGPTMPMAPDSPTTDVGGPITEDTTWTQAGSPYIAISSVLVMDGVTLTIEPGVEVRFDGNYALQVDGQLIARGTSTDPITFTANVAPGWGYILFSDSSVDAVYDVGGNYVSGSILEYAVVEYAGYASVSNNAAVRMDDAHPFISNSTIRDSQAAGISAWDLSGTLRITGSTIEGSGASGIEAWFLPGTLEVLNSTVRNNGASGIRTIGLSNWGGDSGAVNILNNAITGNSGHGVYFSINYYNAADVVISGNAISNNSSDRGGAIYAHYLEYKTGWFKTIEISGNVIHGNSASEDGGAIWYDYSCAECGVPGSTVTISHNVISGNSATVNGGGIWAGHNVATITNNAFADNTSHNSSAVCFCEGGQGDGDFGQNTIMNNHATGSGSTCAVYVRSHPHINQNSILNNTATYELWNSNAEGTANVDAENNWWGTTSSGEIAVKIYDWFDDPDLGMVDYVPYLTSPDTDAPISPPSGLTATPSGMTIDLDWSANPEGDRAGYKVYYDTDEAGFPYEGSGAAVGDSPIDVGNVTTFSLTDLPSGTYHVSVTAYDTAADGVDDWTDGNESWFAPNQEVLIVGAPQANFVADPISGTLPLTVTFTDQSIGSISTWDWDFGDGASSVVQNPAHVYTRTGTYTVSLTVDGPGGSDTETKADYIAVDYAPSVYLPLVMRDH